MKSWANSLWLTLVLAIGSQAQTFDQSLDAQSRGDYRTSLSGFKVLAAQGDAEAQVQLGLMLDLGQGSPKDSRQAVEWYRRAAEQGNADGQFLLGRMYEKGEGVPKDAQQGLAWVRKAADQGLSAAQVSLGLDYQFGVGVPKDHQQAVTWYRRAAEQRYATAEFRLGWMYDSGMGVPKDSVQAFTWVRKAAEQGHAEAQLKLGLMYDSGSGVSKNGAQAVVWYRKAAEQGNAEAQTMLGKAYEDGGDVSRDARQAAVWYQKAADQGEALAQYFLGVLYLEGRGAPKDEKQAMHWFEKAAEQGNTYAQKKLASLKQPPANNVAPTVEATLSMARRSADRGDPQGQLLLGVMYSMGNGVSKDDKQAAFWYRKSADQGNVDAQLKLAAAYGSGRGVPKSEQTSYFWALLAGASGNNIAKKLMEFSEQRLTQEQRETVQTAAQKWQPKIAAEPDSVVGSDDGGGPGATPNGTTPKTAQSDSTGSGFRVVRGAIVTNHHVIAGCNRLRVNGVSAKMRSSDARSDLALLTVEVPGSSVRLRAQRATVGEQLAVAGYPLHGLLSGFNMTTGNLSSLSGMGGDTRLVQITAPVQPGNSGGPVLDSAGNLMGVVVSKLDAIKAAKITGDIPQNVNFAINANVLRSFLDANSVEYETASSDIPIASTAIAAKAKGFTVLVECWK